MISRFWSGGSFFRKSLNVDAFFGKAWMWKLREGCLLELIRARSLQLSAMNAWEWMQRSNKFGLSAANKWEWMWKSKILFDRPTDWVRRDAVCGNKKGFMWRKRTSGKRLQIFLDFSVPYIHKERERFQKKETLLPESNTETWNWNPFSSKWAKSLLKTRSQN